MRQHLQFDTRGRISHYRTLATVGIALAGSMVVAASVRAQSAARDSVPLACSTRILHVSHASSRESIPQPAIIRVTVTDSAGKPLRYATVLYRPTPLDVWSDTNGVALLRVPSGWTRREARLSVRRFWYVVRDTPLMVEPGDTVTATAVLCPRPPAHPVTVVTQTGTTHTIRISSRSTDSTRGPLPTVAGCLPPTFAGVFLQNVRAIASGDYPYAEVRERAHMPRTPRADVQLVQDSTLCAAAAAAYDRELVRLEHTVPRLRTVHVVKVGVSGYVIVDPTVQAGEWTPAIFVDPSMTRFIANWAD